HPAATAAAIATVHAESDGRAVLGIGRGDSSLAHLGLSPAPPAVFARYLERLQGYLRGDEVPFDVDADGRGRVATSEAWGMAGGVASFARFSVMHGEVAGPLDEGGRRALAAVHDSYDMNRHFTHGSPQSVALTDDVIDAFGIAGPPSYCQERLLALVELGITR